MEVEAKPRYVPKGNPNWKKGVSGNPSGKPSGVLGKFQMERALGAMEDGPDPLTFMIAIMRRDEAKLREWNVPLNSITTGVRMRAGENAMPYVHRKMPMAIDGGEGKPLTLLTPEVVAKLTDEELGKLAAVMTILKAAADTANAQNAANEARTINGEGDSWEAIEHAARQSE